MRLASIVIVLGLALLVVGFADRRDGLAIAGAILLGSVLLSRKTCGCKRE